MDSMLKCVLDSKDEAERGRLLDELIWRIRRRLSEKSFVKL
jgi:hypothetical protein